MLVRESERRKIEEGSGGTYELSHFLRLSPIQEDRDAFQKFLEAICGRDDGDEGS